MSNRRGEVTRAALVDAGWRLLDRMTVVDLAASLQASDIAREAGRTSGAFFHHFETPADFAEALVEAFQREVDGDRLREVIEASAAAPLPNVAQLMRETAGAAWEAWSRDEHVGREFRRFLRLTALSAGDTPDPTSAKVREAAWELPLDALEAGFKLHWARIGREPREPFDHRSVALVITALLMGLSLANEVGVPVKTEVVAELVPAIIASMSQRQGVEGSTEALDAELEVPGVAASALDLGDPATDVLLAAIGERARAEGARLEMAGVAAAARMRVCDAVATFETPTRAAALSARVELAAIRDAAWRYLDEEPRRALSDALVALARAARSWGWVTSALLAERSAVDRSVSPPVNARILTDVPLSCFVVEPLVRLTAMPVERAKEQAELAVDLVLQVAASRVRMAPHDVALLAMRAVDLPVG